MWEELTGIKINPIGKPFPELFPAQVAEHLGATGAYDVLSMVPSWTADFVAQGMAEPLDPYIEQYMAPADLDDYHPLYKGLMKYGGKRYGLFDDGDTIILYYRTDLFEDPANNDAFKAQYGHDLAAPKDWTEYDQIQSFFTEQGGGNSWGGASQRAPGQVYGWFSEEFRNRGGRFFDDASLDATLDSQAGIDTLTRMIESNKTMPPGVETWGFIEVLTAWMAGQLAMIGGTWPPIGRWSEGTTAEQLSWVPETQVKGKVGYSVMPMGHSLHNAGFCLAVSADSPNKEAAYLFIQWMTSPTISLQRVMLPYALRDPYRLSHYASEEYRGRWPNAGDVSRYAAARRRRRAARHHHAGLGGIPHRDRSARHRRAVGNGGRSGAGRRQREVQRDHRPHRPREPDGGLRDVQGAQGVVLRVASANAM